MLRLKILTCISIIYLIDTIICFDLVALDPEDDRIQDRNRLISTNKVSLVKRLVPRGYKTPEFEYDRQHKSVFVPKYRVHKRKPIRDGKVLTELYKLLLKPNVSGNENPITILMLGKNGRYTLRQGEYDPIGSRSKRPIMKKDKDSESQEKEKFPRFSLYNYWTYDKALLHDLCPPQQAKLGHRCIYAPILSSLRRH